MMQSSSPPCCWMIHRQGTLSASPNTDPTTIETPRPPTEPLKTATISRIFPVCSIDMWLFLNLRQTQQQMLQPLLPPPPPLSLVMALMSMMGDVSFRDVRIWFMLVSMGFSLLNRRRNKKTLGCCRCSGYGADANGHCKGESHGYSGGQWYRCSNSKSSSYRKGSSGSPSSYQQVTEGKRCLSN